MVKSLRIHKDGDAVVLVPNDSGITELRAGARSDGFAGVQDEAEAAVEEVSDVLRLWTWVTAGIMG
jgi:hypothetical protein